MKKEDMVDLLRSLSIIEGAICTCESSVQERVNDELEWCVEMLLNKIKESK